MFLSLLLAAAQAVQPMPPGLLRADMNRDGIPDTDDRIGGRPTSPDSTEKG